MSPRDAIKLVLAIALALAALGQAVAEDSETATESPAFMAFNLTGAHELSYAMPAGGYSWDSGYDGEMKYPQLINDLGLDATIGQIGVVSKWEIQSLEQHGEAINNLRYVENYIAWNPEKFRFSFGYQVFSWGVADGRNPTDNINPEDYTTLEGDKVHKIPVLAIGASWYPGEEWSLDSVYVPLPLDSLFPEDYVRSLRNEGINASLDEVEDKPENFVAGGKLNYRSPAMDFSVSYLYDFDRMYTPSVTDDFGVSLERKRVHRIGADMKTTLGRYGLWAEACYSLTGNSDPSSYAERLSSLDYTLGFDFSYGPGDDYYLNLQYTGTVYPGYDSSADTFSQSDPRYLEKELLYQLAGVDGGLTQGLTWNARWSFADGAIVPSFTGSYSLPFYYDSSSVKYYGSMLLKPQIDFMPIDSFHIVVVAILAYSWVNQGEQCVALDTSDLVGVYTPENNVFLSVTYMWSYDK